VRDNNLRPLHSMNRILTKLSVGFAFTHSGGEAQAKNATKEDYKGDSKFASHLKTSRGCEFLRKKPDSSRTARVSSGFCLS
jgi:hypothetical protein